jgi:DNA invertase Pin-like site-specific DNA recombinase
MSQAVIYTRVSSEKQAGDHNFSLQAQLQACHDYCAENGYRVIAHFSEIKSARGGVHRPELESALKLLNSNVTLVVYKVCRLSRSVMAGSQMLERIKEQKSNLVSVTEKFNVYSGSGRFTFHTLLSAAEHESDLISERVRLVNSRKRALGHEFGTAPFGKRATTTHTGVRQFEVDPAEQNIIRLVRMLSTANTPLSEVNAQLKKTVKTRELIELENEDGSPATHITDGLTTRNIADLLNDYKITKRGQMWSTDKVRRLLDIGGGMDKMRI